MRDFVSDFNSMESNSESNSVERNSDSNSNSNYGNSNSIPIQIMAIPIQFQFRSDWEKPIKFQFRNWNWIWQANPIPDRNWPQLCYQPSIIANSDALHLIYNKINCSYPWQNLSCSEFFEPYYGTVFWLMNSLMLVNHGKIAFLKNI